MERRTYSPLSEIPQYMIDALLATEDKNFINTGASICPGFHARF